MKPLAYFIFLSLTFAAFAQTNRPYSAVYCDRWTSGDGSRSGYSLYRQMDHRDIGNAIFSEYYECRDAAEVANQSGNDITCAKYYNRNTQRSFYSVYKISSLQDLGRWGFSDFYTCQTSVRYSRRNIFCATYVKNNSESGFSPWDIRTNQDVGTTFYSNMEGCLQRLGVKERIEIDKKLINIAEEK